ncbi:MAG TPA: radical SAM protein [Candidatus Eisenbacteria bacterium]|nr:radical SAM protein [Candidatus Eisenbacteria bacterium]
MAGRTIVFVEPPYVCWDRRMDRVRQGEEDIPGVGTLVLAALARERGHRVHVVDGKRAGTPVDEVAWAVARHRPDHVGISATTISVTNAARIAARLKELVPDAIVTVGGPHVSAVPETTLERFLGFDYGVVGEGERSYFALIDALDAGASPADVPGLVHRDGGHVRANPRAPYLDGVELDELPDPAWDLVPDFPLRFQPNVFNYRASPVASLVTSRGCPFSCTFCDRSTSGRRGRYHGVDYVLRQCRRLAGMGVRHVLFYDDLFTVNKARVVELCERLLEERLGFTWSCNSHPNLLDPKTLRLMRRAGCWQIAYGIESGSQRVLDVVKHEVRIPRMLQTLRQTREAGIRVKGLMMMAHPTEDETSLAETVDFLRTAPIDLVQITKFTPYPGTPSYPTVREHGTFVEDWERMNAMNWVFVPNGLTPEVLERYFRLAYRTFYGRRDVLWGLAKTLAGEPRFLRRVATYVRVGVRDWLWTPTAPTPA